MSGDGRGGEDIEAGEGPGAAAEQDLEEGRKELKQSAASEAAEKVNTDGCGGGEASSPTGSREENEGGPQGGRLAAAAAGQRARVVSDPISESYRSIVEVINRTSEGFREGKKWKCAAGAPIKAERPKQQQAQQQVSHTQRAREHRKAAARHHGGRGKGAMERSHTTDADGGGARASGGKEKRLVRQAACAAEDASTAAQQLLSPPPGAHLRLSPTAAAGRAPPARQWTVDACTAPAIGQAYLLRPVSRSSIRSAASGGDDCGGAGAGAGGRRLSPAGAAAAPCESQCAGGFRAKSAARSPAAERARLVEIGNRNSGRSFSASFNIETNDGAAVSIRSSTSRSGSGRTAATLTATRHRMRKQRTCDSAPMRGSGGSGGTAGAATSLSGSNRHLPRQFSNASAYSAAAAFIPTSISHQGMTLVRGASCSLVDIPTYLGQSYGGVELAQICDVKMVPTAASTTTATPACGSGAAASEQGAALEESPATAAAAGGDATDLSQQRKNARPRLQVRYRRT